MIFRSQCPTSALVAWCRALKHGLGVGLSPTRVFRQQARSGPAALRTVAERIADRVDTGDSLSDAIKPEVGLFPVLFVESIAVGEQAGRLVDVLSELENHYTAMQTARSRFLVSLIWPMISLFGGIFILTIMIAVLGAVSPGMDPLGLGLTGISGAIIFFVTSCGIVLAIVGIVNAIANDETLKSKALGIGMNIPGFTGCVRAFALQRFSLAFRFMAESGVKADRTMAVALRATANRAYRDHEATAAKKVRKGSEVTEVMADCGTNLFPEEFQEATRVGEETGQLAEVMERQARHYQEESDRKMTVVTRLAGFSVYAMIALLLIVTIFKLYGSVLDPYQNPDLKALNKMAGFPE